MKPKEARLVMIKLTARIEQLERLQTMYQNDVKYADKTRQKELNLMLEHIENSLTELKRIRD